MTSDSGMNVRRKWTKWLTVARIPIGSHHEVSISTDGSERLHAIINYVSSDPAAA